MVREDFKPAHQLTKKMKNDTNNNNNSDNNELLNINDKVDLVKPCQYHHTEKRVTISEEKHVTIEEELPLVYKPKSFSVPDLLALERSYADAQHPHPLLKMSIYKTTSDIDVRKFIRKQSLNPLDRLRLPVKWSPSTPVTGTKWKKNEFSRGRGQSYPPGNVFTATENEQSKKHDYLNELNRKKSTSKKHDKISQFWAKLNIFKKPKGIRRKSSSYNIPIMTESVSTSKLIENKNENKSDTENHAYRSYSHSSYDHESADDEDSSKEPPSETVYGLCGKTIDKYNLHVPRKFNFASEAPNELYRIRSLPIMV